MLAVRTEGSALGEDPGLVTPRRGRGGGSDEHHTFVRLPLRGSGGVSGSTLVHEQRQRQITTPARIVGEGRQVAGGRCYGLFLRYRRHRQRPEIRPAPSYGWGQRDPPIANGGPSPRLGLWSDGGAVEACSLGMATQRRSHRDWII
jgi:hypothetical protein